MGGPCMDGGGTLAECFLNADMMTKAEMEKRERFPEFLGVEDRGEYVLVYERNSGRGLARVSHVDKATGTAPIDGACLFFYPEVSDGCVRNILRYRFAGGSL